MTVAEEINCNHENYSVERLYLVSEYRGHGTDLNGRSDLKVRFDECRLDGWEVIPTGRTTWLKGEGASTFIELMKMPGFERHFRGRFENGILEAE